MSNQYQCPFWTPDDSLCSSMMSIDDSMRKRSQSGSNELRERLSVAAVRAKRAGMMQHKFQQKSTKRESVDGSIGRALATSTGTIEF